MKEIQTLQREGEKLINQRIKEWKENGEGFEPSVSVDSLLYQSRFLLLESQIDLTMDIWLFTTDLMNEYLTQCFQIELLKYELNFQNTFNSKIKE